MGILLCFLPQLMADVSSFYCPITLQLKSNTEIKTFIKTTVTIHNTFKGSSVTSPTMLIALYQVQFPQRKFCWTWDIGDNKMNYKILIDNQTVNVKTTNIPSSSGKSRTRPQMLHSHNCEDMVNLKFIPQTEFLNRSVVEIFLTSWNLYRLAQYSSSIPQTYNVLLANSLGLKNEEKECLWCDRAQRF